MNSELTYQSYRELLRKHKDELKDCTHGTCRECDAVFRVDAETHHKLRSLIRHKREHGGSMLFDFQNRKLVAGRIESGQYSSISMDRGGVDFHTHPALCLNDDTCALGLPSPMDLQNITMGCLFGTVGHMVYSREGTYLVQLDPTLLNKLANSLDDFSLFLADVDRTFNALHKEFIKNKREPYKKYASRFKKVARQIGFRIKLFKGNTVPRIRFKCVCALLQNGSTMSPKVTVPVELEKLLTVT